MAYDGSGNLVSRTLFPGICVGGSREGQPCSDANPCDDSTCGERATVTYDVHHNLLSITDHLGETTTFTYDAYHKPLATINPLGDAVSQSYLSDGRPATTRDANGATYLCEYDKPLGQPTRVYNPLDADLDGELDSATKRYKPWFCGAAAYRQTTSVR